MIVLRMFERVLECRVVGGDHDGETALIPRISLTPSNSTDFTFKFTRRQFPVRLAFALTINNTTSSSFYIGGEQYTNAYRDLAKNVSSKDSCPKFSFSIKCTIADSPHYAGTKKPLPWNKRFVMVSGELSGITTELLSDGGPGLKKVCFSMFTTLHSSGTTYVPPADSGTPGSSTSTPAAPRKRWSFTPSGERSAKRAKTSGECGDRLFLWLFLALSSEQ
ncbi:hypothetical protein GGX14DRAFT_570091 [Mycena pura]|uniref:Uncharacterized protein n=1 Tax=Mycena pura TaxID=153505 RepID=A0AAD6YDA5_9AGAR|nr:hypothetical protein GGX14DRAFT_570091 [Mycena pura]